jgi:cytoskeletal protein CcmA (bactofilin family)
MAMFRKGSEKENAPEGTSIISSDMSMAGNVTFKGLLRLDGKVEGNVKGEHLILGVTAKVVGDVDAANLVCHGHVEGNVTAKKLHVTKGATITGRVMTADLSVESGALLNGEIKSPSQDLRLLPDSSKPESGKKEELKVVSGADAKKV